MKLQEQLNDWANQLEGVDGKPPLFPDTVEAAFTAYILRACIACTNGGTMNLLLDAVKVVVQLNKRIAMALYKQSENPYK